MGQAFQGMLRSLWRPMLLLALVTMLSACAARTGGSGSTGSGAEPVTASDEPAGRRRARIRLELAVGYFQQGQATVALDEIKQAISADPSLADAYNLRGLVYMRLDDAGLAEDSFRRAIALSPRDANSLHNYGWLLCQQGRYGEAAQQFGQALAVPGYADRAKTFMAQGACEVRVGRLADAERSLAQAYELDAGNPMIGFNLASVLAQRQDWARSQFYVRPVNNGPAANAETLWLGIRVEQRLDNREAMARLGGQLQRRFPQSREAIAYERGNFND